MLTLFKILINTEPSVLTLFEIVVSIGASILTLRSDYRPLSEGKVK
jgi:hypothetical protein